MASNLFTDFNTSDFWSDSEYSARNYVEPPPTEEMIAFVEKQLGYKLPDSYVELMRTQNGGLVKKTCFPTTTATSWADNHIAITGIFGIGDSKEYSLCGDSGSRFWIEEWCYPDIGVCICDTPSAGHDLVMLDYSVCGAQGEPRVIHVDGELDNEITILAPTFEAFVRGLVSEEIYDTSAEDLQQDLDRIESGRFSTVMADFFALVSGRPFEKPMRCLLADLTRKKGYFALHDDEQSMLVYDLQFYIWLKTKGSVTREDYLKAYPSMIAFSNGDISTKGYAPAFVEGWLTSRIEDGRIGVDDAGTMSCESGFEVEILLALQAYGGD